MRGCWPFRRKKQADTIEWLPGDGQFGLEVSGESFYRDAFLAICGEPTSKSVNLVVDAMLIQERDPHDKNAVRVEIQGHEVGHVPRENAKAVRRLMKNQRGWCKAKIRGGWSRKKGSDVGDYGVRLDVKL